MTTPRKDTRTGIELTDMRPRITKAQHRLELPSFTAAVRRLIELGLEAVKGEKRP